MLILAICLLSVNLVALLGGGYVLAKRVGIIEENFFNIQDFLTPQAEGEASPFIQLIGQVGESVSAKVGEHVSATINGAIGGSMKGVTSELEREAIANNPTLAILDGMPKAIKKNPLAMLAMQQLVNKNLPLGGGAIGGGKNGGNTVKFDL